MNRDFPVDVDELGVLRGKIEAIGSVAVRETARDIQDLIRHIAGAHDLYRISAHSKSTTDEGKQRNLDMSERMWKFFHILGGMTGPAIAAFVEAVRKDLDAATDEDATLLASDEKRAAKNKDLIDKGLSAPVNGMTGN